MANRPFKLFFFIKNYRQWPCMSSLSYSIFMLQEASLGGKPRKIMGWWYTTEQVPLTFWAVYFSPIQSPLSDHWIWYLTFTWHCKASSSLNSESSGKDTLSKTVSSKFHPLHLFCLFFHPFKHGLLWKSEKRILLFRSEYMVYVLFSEEQELYPTLTA